MQTETDGVPIFAKHHFRYYDKKERKYYGLFEVYWKKDGCYYWPCKNGCSLETDSVGPFASVEEAIADAREE
jgi:hypothetical protein